MQIISRRARAVCVMVATVTSTILLGSTVLGLTSTPSAPVALALMAGDPVSAAFTL